MGSEYVSLAEAARVSGVSRSTLVRRVNRGVLRDYQSGADRRLRLVRVADLENMVAPVPRQNTTEERQRRSVAA